MILALSAAILVARRVNQPAGEAIQAQTETSASVILADGTSIEGISIDGMSREEAKAAVMAAYPWKLRASYGDKTETLTNLFEVQLDQLLDQICTNNTAGAYTIDESRFSQAAEEEASRLATLWDVKAKNSTLTGFDNSTAKYTFSEGSAGVEIDQAQLAAEIEEALRTGDFDQILTVTSHETEPESDETVRSRYRILASFTTNTTANAKRNTNVKLAADALNGTLVRPGEEFSFNAAIGPRTAEKGYQEAAAYNSGAVVQEIGGGVCQISSTLYRVAFQAGMEITFRRSHTFEPNYVTPGQDATISWDQPDFRFVNTASSPIVIRASYSDQKASVSIYGIPVLEDGITWDLDSEKVEDTDIPAPEYIEDQTLPPGTEKLEKAGSQGSTWVTYKVVYQDGKEIERVKDHEKTYKGHAPVIRRNSSDVQLSPDETEAPAETPAPTVDGMPEDYVPGSSDTKEGSGTKSSTAAGNGNTNRDEDRRNNDETAATSAASTAAAEESTVTKRPEGTAASQKEELSAPGQTAQPVPTTAAPSSASGENASGTAETKPEHSAASDQPQISVQ